jgi:hypothetical protein
MLPPFSFYNSKFTINGNFEYTLAVCKADLRFARRNSIPGVVFDNNKPSAHPVRLTHTLTPNFVRLRYARRRVCHYHGKTISCVFFSYTLRQFHPWSCLTKAVNMQKLEE